jgi:membrane-associated PAP2 superfamily phosphatase
VQLIGQLLQRRRGSFSSGRYHWGPFPARCTSHGHVSAGAVWMAVMFWTR